MHIFGAQKSLQGLRASISNDVDLIIRHLSRQGQGMVLHKIRETVLPCAGGCWVPGKQVDTECGLRATVATVQVDAGYGVSRWMLGTG